MMAHPVLHRPTEKKRVKVYELRNNDWFDRGTGFCTAAYVPVRNGKLKEPRLMVAHENDADRILLEIKISKEDAFHRQQDTLIVWTETSNNVDMALSFQEANGCMLIWKFIDTIQQSFNDGLAPDDSMSDDMALDILPQSCQLPAVELGNINTIDQTLRALNQTPSGREMLTKYVIHHDYIRKLVPLVAMAEDLESLDHLHRLCCIMKTILLLNDTAIIETAVSDDCVLGVVGALEYDPDFPSHKANHRQWLSSQGRFKEVVKIQDEGIRRKIHQTYRLQYLKDVVLARILDDPTFSVLNSLIFFDQVEIFTHVQSNDDFLGQLFAIFTDPKEDWLRKKEAVLFIQQCCAIAKNLQPPMRQNLYTNFLSHGLQQVIDFGLRNHDVTVRVGATDILVSMIDHDPFMIRQTVYRQIQEKQAPLTDTLIDLLLVEVDLGIKSQLSDALKVLLDSSPPAGPPEPCADLPPDHAHVQPEPITDPQHEMFLDHFYEHSAIRLFQPLLDLDKHRKMHLGALNDGIFSYLSEILCFYIRQHKVRSKTFVMQHGLAQRFLQLLDCKEKHLQLVAIRFIRHLVLIQDQFLTKHIMDRQLLGPILDVLGQSVRRDNLLSSACLDLLGLIGKDFGIKDLIKHLNISFRQKLEALSHLNTIRDVMAKYDQTQGYTNGLDYYLDSENEGVRKRPHARGMMEHLSVDPVQEEYWNTSDDEGEHPIMDASRSLTNGPAPKLLVDYSSDEDDGNDKAPVHLEGGQDEGAKEKGVPMSRNGRSTPPERLSEKRRREEDEEDGLEKLVHHKRRNSICASMNGVASTETLLRRKKSLSGARDMAAGDSRKISITMTPNSRSLAVKTSSPSGDGDAS